MNSVHPQQTPDVMRAQAEQLLHDACSPYGLHASGIRGGYHNLWARDSMISALGALASDDPTLIAAVGNSLDTLSAHQTELGLIPNKIDFDTPPRVNFRAYADGGLWFVLVTARFLTRFPEHPSAARLIDSASRALTWYRYQDHDQSGLIGIQEGSTWMDLFPLRGKSIYVNALRYWATTEFATLLTTRNDTSRAQSLTTEAGIIRDSIHERLWYEPGKDPVRLIQDSFSTSSYNEKEMDALGRHLLRSPTPLPDEAFFVPYVTMRDYGNWFDTFGNLIAILGGVATPAQKNAILAYIERHALAEPYPVQAMHPPLTEGDADWRYYFAFGDLNRPHHYHNGGIWPMIGGFYVWALCEAGEITQAHRALAALAKANAQTRNTEDIEARAEFAEYLEATSGVPCGMQDQTWSAALYIAAHARVKDTECAHASALPPTQYNERPLAQTRLTEQTT